MHAVGEIDTSFADVPEPGPAREKIHALALAWPTIASDLAGLVGTLNDNLDNDRALAELDALGDPLGTSGLVAFAWGLLGAGALAAAAVLVASPLRPGRRKELT